MGMLEQVSSHNPALTFYTPSILCMCRMALATQVIFFLTTPLLSFIAILIHNRKENNIKLQLTDTLAFHSQLTANSAKSLVWNSDAEHGNTL